jgi:thioesterase domain-containing protein
VAFEMARRLREAGEPVPLLVLIEASTTGAGPRAAWRRLRREGLRLARTWRYYLGRLDQVRHSGRGERSRLIRRAIGSRLATVWRRLLPGGPATPGAPSQAAVDLREVYARAVRRYVPGRYDSPIVVFRATESGAVRRPDLGWKDVADRVEVREARGAHLTMITWHVAALGEELRVCLAKAQEPWIAAP